MITIMMRGILSLPIDIALGCLCDWFVVYIMVWAAGCFLCGLLWGRSVTGLLRAQEPQNEQDQSSPPWFYLFSR